MELLTERLRLERVSERDLASFARLSADAEVMRFIGDGAPWPPQVAEQRFGRILEQWKAYDFGWRSAFERETGRWVGFLGLNYVPVEAVEVPDGEVEIGWWLEPAAWGRGLATEGARALRDEAFERVGLERIIGRFQPANAASGRIMEKLAMHFERDAVGRHGETVRIYALERADWLAATGCDN